MGACILYRCFLPSLYSHFWNQTLCVGFGGFISYLTLAAPFYRCVLITVPFLLILARPVSLDQVSCIRDNVLVIGRTCFPHTRGNRECRCPSAAHALRVLRVKAMLDRK